MKGGVGLDARKNPWGQGSKSQPWALGRVQFIFHFCCKKQLKTEKESLLSSQAFLGNTLADPSERAGCSHPVSIWIHWQSPIQNPHNDNTVVEPDG